MEYWTVVQYICRLDTVKIIIVYVIVTRTNMTNANRILVGPLVGRLLLSHYSDVGMSEMASPITGVPMVCSNVCSEADQTKHQISAISASLAFERGIHRWPVDSHHKWPVTHNMNMFSVKECMSLIKHIPSLKNVLIICLLISIFMSPLTHRTQLPSET